VWVLFWNGLGFPDHDADVRCPYGNRQSWSDFQTRRHERLGTRAPRVCRSQEKSHRGSALWVRSRSLCFVIDVVTDFLDYYFQNLGYLTARKQRRTNFDLDTAARGVRGPEYAQEFKSYCGRERVVLRRRRTKLKVDQFHIIAQVGQGGYGEVYLARKQDSGEVCALKKMRKRTLHKMDEASAIRASLSYMVFRSFIDPPCSG
jgi:serine/threonine protein kinase